MASFGEPSASQQPPLSTPPFILPEPFLSPPAPPPSLATAMSPSAGGCNSFPLQSPAPVGASALIDEVLQYLRSNQFLIIEAMMVLAIIMSCIMFIGSARKVTSNAFFKKCLWVTVVSTPLFISYCVGQMTNNIHGSGYQQNELFFIWGVLLLSGLAGYGTLSAFELGDNETALIAHLQGYLKCTFVFGILLHYNDSEISPLIQWFLRLLVPLILLRLYDRACSLAFASKTNLSQGVGAIVELVAEFTEWDVQKAVLTPETTDPKSMHGYRYLVGMKHLLLKKKPESSQPCFRRDFGKEQADIVTTQDIWQCEGELLSSRGGDPKGRLKDTCLSFALFWMLLRRYTGYPLVEVNLVETKTWDFVRYGLIPDLTDPTTERAFRVIEQELSFLYDYFYTKNFVIYMYGTHVMFLRFLLMVAYVGIAELILKNDKKSLPLVLSHHLRPIQVDKIITRVVIYTMLIFELVLMIHYLLITQWSKMEWVCTYVRKQLWRSRGYWKDICLRWAIKYICLCSLSKNFKHWKGEIGQYSLLKSHHYFHPMYYFAYVIRLLIPLTLLDIPKWGRRESKSIPSCVNLKKAVMSSLHTNGRQLTNGKSSLRKHGLLQQTDFFWACNLDTDTHTILVWHIATSFCELTHQNRHPGNLNQDYLFVATSLSKYCAYLVAFVPELLPDQRNKTFKIINHVILEANDMFKGCSTMEGKYEKMRSMTAGQYEDAKDPILNKGIWLGKSLVDRMGTTESLWKMLEEFWAELLLYLAPSDDVAAHVKHLANGGEFITHLWALLTHAGILKRD